MGTLHQNRKGVPAEIKSAKLKKGEQVSVRLMIMKWKNKKDICLTSTTHDEMVPIRVQGQDMEKAKVIIDYNSRTGDVDLNDAYLTSYRSTRKRQKKKKILSKALLSF
jgi:phosphatidylserine decarboxylase